MESSKCGYGRRGSAWWVLDRHHQYVASTLYVESEGTSRECKAHRKAPFLLSGTTAATHQEPLELGTRSQAGSDRAGPGTAGFPRAGRPEAGQGCAAAILRAGGGRMAAGGWCGHRALRALRAASGSHWGRPAVPGEAGGSRGDPGGALVPAVAFPRGGRERGAHGLRLSCRAQGGRWQLPPPLRRGGARRDLRGAERAEKIQRRPHRCAGEVGG